MEIPIWNVCYTFIFLERKTSLTSKMFYFKDTRLHLSKISGHFRTDNGHFWICVQNIGHFSHFDGELSDIFGFLNTSLVIFVQRFKIAGLLRSFWISIILTAIFRRYWRSKHPNNGWKFSPRCSTFKFSYDHQYSVTKSTK